MKGKVQIPVDIAEAALYACLHLEAGVTEGTFCKSIQQFIKNDLQSVDQGLFEKLRRYTPSPQSLYRALGKRSPGYVSNSYFHQLLPRLLVLYIGKFEKKYPKEAEMFKKGKMNAGAEEASKKISTESGKKAAREPQAVMQPEDLVQPEEVVRSEEAVRPGEVMRPEKAIGPEVVVRQGQVAATEAGRIEPEGRGVAGTRPGGTEGGRMRAGGTGTDDTRAGNRGPGSNGIVEKLLPALFRDYIEQKSSDFTGRQWLFDQLSSLIYTQRPESYYRSGYLLIHGEPGIGKTAVLARLAAEYGYVHHFNIQNDGINTAQVFLQNISYQLSERYGLADRYEPADRVTNSIILHQLLKSVSRQLSGSKAPCIILIDAIDEVKSVPGEKGNVLCLPDHLPDHIYFILSCRSPEQIALSTHSRLEKLPIIGSSGENMADAAAYLKTMVRRDGVRTYLQRWQVGEEDFLSTLLVRSEGNFIYLFHVIREISDGIYTSTTLSELPRGLRQYYEEHWQVIRGEDGRKWSDHLLPVLTTLVIAGLPVDVQFICQYSGAGKMADIVDALMTWRPFLHKNGDKYSLYHQSFTDFLGEKEQIKAEAMDLIQRRRELIANMRKDLS